MTPTMRVLPGLILLLSLACHPRPFPAAGYRLAAVDGRRPPVTMFTYAGDNQSQLMSGSLRPLTGDRTVYDWHFRVLYPDGRADTLEPGTDTFAVHRQGDSVLLLQSFPCSIHGTQLCPDTTRAFVTSDSIYVRTVEMTDSVYLEHLLVFVPE